MLHNTGQYGANDVPNVANNLDKMPQQPPMNMHYNLPEYNPYGLNMNAGLSQFHNFHPVGFAQNPLNWQNNLPMNLNMHSQLNYNHAKPDEYKEMNKNMFNVPQVHTKAFHKHSGMDLNNYQNYKNYTDYNPDLTKTLKVEDSKNYNSHYLEQNLELSKEKMVNYTKPVTIHQKSETSNKHDKLNLQNHIDLSMKSQKLPTSYPEDLETDVKPSEPLPLQEAHLDLSKPQKPETSSLQFNSDYNSRFFKDQDSRRRSLENTVKMIENILSHTSNTRKTELSSDENKTKAQVENKILIDLLTKNSKIASDSNENSSTSISSTLNDTKNPVTDKAESSSLDSDKNPNNILENDKNSDEMSSDEDVKPEVKTEDVETIPIKIEVVPIIADMDHLNPFHRDTFGVLYKNIGDNDIVDSEKSVALAKELVQNKIQVTGAFFECPHCALFFSNPKRFLIHTKWHTFGLTNEKRIEMQKEKEMKRHMKKEARVMEKMNQSEVIDVNTPGKKFACKECDKVFSVKASLNNHKQRYHPTNRIRNCKICGKIINNWNAMRVHLATHTGEDGYQCDDCPKRFKHPHSLAKHRDTHKEKTHGCQQCPKKFGSAALLNVHMKTHERVLRGATFGCAYCGKGFFESYSLQVHERTHRNERPFLCEICNTSFGTNSSLKRHLKVSHNTSKPYQCPTCHRNFISEAIRDRHMQRNHGNPEDFKFLCKQCPCKYLKLKDLRKHTYKAHPKGRRKRKAPSDSE